MAWIEKERTGGNFTIAIEFNGKRTKIATRTRNRAIAEAMLQKVNDLQSAYACGLLPDECGLADWCVRLYEHNNYAYGILARRGLVPPVELLLKPSADIIVPKKSAIIPEGVDVYETAIPHYTHVFEGTDRIVYSKTKKHTHIVVFLTKETADRYNIKSGLCSVTSGDSVMLKGGNRSVKWKITKCMYHFYGEAFNPPYIERRWEMYAPVFKDESTITRGRMIARHVLPSEEKED